MAVGKLVKAGFTLVELLVAITVAAILVTAAIPNYQQFVARNKLASDYNEILATFNFAKSEAVKRRAEVTSAIQFSAGSPGWSAAVWIGDGTASVSCPADSECLKYLERSGSPVMVSSVGSAFATFSPLGRLSSGLSMSLGVSHPAGYSNSLCVSPSGKVDDEC